MYEIYGYPFGNPDAELLIYRPGNTQALVLSPKLTREVSKGGSLVFTMPQDHPQYSMLQKMSTVVVAKRDGKEIWRGRVLKHEANFYNQRVVYCEGALSYFNDSSITPFNYKGTLRQFLQHIVDAHNDQVKSQMKCFQLGTVTAALGNMQVQFGDADQYGVGEDYGKVWDILDKLVLKVFGGYFYCGFDAATGYNVLNYCDQAYEEKRQTVQKIEYGRNLLNLSETTDATDLYTRIYPIGNKHTVDTSKWYYKLMWWRDPSKDKHEERWGIMETDAATVAQYLPAAGYSYNLQEGWIQNDTAVQKFGIITRIVEFDTDSANDTFAAGVQALQQNYAMKISYVIRAVDLVDAGYDTDRLDFAMYSHVVSAPHSVDAIMLCTKLVEPFDHPDKKEYSFGMTRRTLTDRQAANIGRTNLLEEQAATSANSTEALLKNLNAYKKSNDAAVADAAKTATNFLSFDASSGLIVGHESLPDKKVQITNSGVKVLSGSSMVNITAKSISITDGAGSCSISSGAITFHGIKNQKPIYAWGKLDLFSASTLTLDLSSYSAVLITFESKKGSTWLASGGGAGPVSVVLPVNGKTYSMVYPWNTVHRRDVTVKASGIIFGSGQERTSFYTTGIGTAATFINLESPVKDGWTGNDAVCMPIELYGFM
uniref:Endopeptidase tail n=1 Tax=Siphoviridae sp. ctL5G6 TaxID=2826247 RepID=A0A8S5NA61_9CAUD|nr:MAG TPA: endopeptidase tail [Siphoviridae sp. ctL5G6]